MPLLDPSACQSPSLSGDEFAVTETATGDGLGTVTRATAEDVGSAAATARAAQTEWARVPHLVRASVLRKAGDLFTAPAGKLRGWLVR